MRKLKLVFKIIIGVSIVLILAFLISIPIVNDRIAYKTAIGIEEIELPDNTVYVETFAKAGKLIGNGNGMQYLGGILIKSELSLQDLQSYYSQFAENEWECCVKTQTDKNISIVEHGTLSVNTDVSNDDNYYIDPVQ